MSSALNFYAPWTAALAAAAASTRPPEPFTYIVGGVSVPAMTCALGAIGVLAARPLARKREVALDLGRFLVVSLIMLIVTELWIIRSRPDWLFAFVVAVGLGFTGYSLIEMLGEEMSDLVRSFFAQVKDRLKRWIGLSTIESPDHD